MIDKETLREWQHRKRFRKPDVFFYDKHIPSLGISAIWYGPAGVEGDYATEVETQGATDFFEVSEYMPLERHEEGSPILKVTSTIDARDELMDTLIKLKVPLPSNVKDLTRYVAALGVAKIAYWGGTEEEVEELPR